MVYISNISEYRRKVMYLYYVLFVIFRTIQLTVLLVFIYLF